MLYIQQLALLLPVNMRCPQDCFVLISVADCSRVKKNVDIGDCITGKPLWAAQLPALAWAFFVCFSGLWAFSLTLTHTWSLCSCSLTPTHLPRLWPTSFGELLWHQNEAWINWLCGETVMFAACSIDSQSPHDQCAVLFHPGRWHHWANL